MAKSWLAMGVGVAVLGGAAWWFGRSVEPKHVAPEPVVAVAAPAVEPTPEPAAPVIDVIDLSRSYEPAPESPRPNDVVAAQYIDQHPRIRATAPSSRELDHIILTGGVGDLHPNAQPEKLKVEPREVPAAIPLPFTLPHDLRHFAEIPWA